MRLCILRAAITLAFGIPMLIAPAAIGETVTACTSDVLCYCVNSDLTSIIDKRVDDLRGLIAAQKAQGKAVGYLSVPISSVAGSYFGVNIDVAAEAKERIESRFGPRAIWVLNPAGRELLKANEKELLPGGNGADYMLMWAKVLKGEDGQGAFDFIYFVGPSEFARYFHFDGNGDMEKLDLYYDNHRFDDRLKAIDKRAFRDYYALRASVAYSLGSHDEWNIVRMINQRRRSVDGKSGIAEQMGVFFDGRPIPPGLFEAPVEQGDAGACRN